MQKQITLRQVAEARKLAQGRAASFDREVVGSDLDIEAKKLGFRSWRRLITVYREQKKNDTQNTTRG